MSRIIHAELWVHPGMPGLIAVTTNSVVKHNGELVMGRGSAGQAAQRIPGIALECVLAIQRDFPRIRLDSRMDYGLVVVRAPTPGKIGFGILQAKRHWQDMSSWATIRIAQVIQVIHPIVRLELLRCLMGKPDRPGHIRWWLACQYRFDHIAFLHRYLYFY